ncbi:MAG: tRNA (uridine(34)/cytosine(34)/5-carboxymethylaminomethyluridine(34)-2'-O)-methyltransferase TrmL [Gammaproteobacteria bacterium]
MLNIALYQPEIPPNTGNIIRLCANTGAQLHLIHPLGFEWDDKRVKRAGLDYHEFTSIKHYENYDDFLAKNKNARLFACSTKGSQYYSEISFQENDTFIFGPETRGLPKEILSTYDSSNILKIPMKPDSRSLNLSNAAAVMLYEAWRQLGFE